jgi:hypothetical protein
VDAGWIQKIAWRKLSICLAIFPVPKAEVDRKGGAGKESSEIAFQSRRPAMAVPSLFVAEGFTESNDCLKFKTFRLSCGLQGRLPSGDSGNFSSFMEYVPILRSWASPARMQ